MRLSKTTIGLLLIVLSLIALTFGSCCPSRKAAERKISRLVECNPSLKEGKKDTVEITLRDTIFIEKLTIEHDTTLKDSLLIEKNGQLVEIIRGLTGTPCDTVEIPLTVRAECPPDTIRIEKRVEVPIETDQINVTDKRGGGFWSKAILFLAGVAVGFILMMILKSRL